MNTVTKINLSNLKKCNQVWTDMPENEKGRLCQKCQNTIIDFRDKSDPEVAHIHLFTEGKVCGLYKNGQIRTQKKKRTTKQFNLYNRFYIGLFSLLSFKSFGLNEKVNIIQTEQTDKKIDVFKNQNFIENNRPRKQIIQDSIYITGTITDTYNLALPGANVIIKGTKIGVSTDFDGNYRLNVTEPLKSTDKIILSYSYVGYQTVEKEINPDLLKQIENRRINIKFEENAEIIAFHVTGKLPLHKRIWRGIKNIF